MRSELAAIVERLGLAVDREVTFHPPAPIGSRLSDVVPTPGELAATEALLEETRILLERLGPSLMAQMVALDQSRPYTGIKGRITGITAS